MIFATYFWVEITREMDARRVCSDLRFMLSEDFEAAGIAIAFPQRDVHLDFAGPLRVERSRRKDLGKQPGEGDGEGTT